LATFVSVTHGGQGNYNGDCRVLLLSALLWSLSL